MVQFKENAWTDGRTNRPYFIGPFRLPPGVQQKFTYVVDIQKFYPSNGEKLLKDAVLLAQTHTNINRKDIEVIFHCRRSLLFHNKEPSIKKDSNGGFDITMGSYDGAEVC